VAIEKAKIGIKETAGTNVREQNEGGIRHFGSICWLPMAT